jgi:hypothetical protein
MIEHATTFNRVLGDFLSRAEQVWKSKHNKATSEQRHLRSVS